MPDARIHTLTYGEAEALAERFLARGLPSYSPLSRHRGD